MTIIRLHGILAQKYGEAFEIDISKPRDVIRAIDANRDGFRKTVVDLQKEGFSYEILVNKKRLNKNEFLNSKKPQEIDFVPFIVGAGIHLLVAVVVAVVSAAIQYALLDPGTIEGGTSTVGGDSNSMTFASSQINLTAQGSPLPIGYGRLKVGSSVIQASMKSLPQTADSIESMTNNPFETSYDEGIDIFDSKRKS